LFKTERRCEGFGAEGWTLYDWRRLDGRAKSLDKGTLDFVTEDECEKSCDTGNIQ
jgi:hypothetical protein